MSSPGTSVAMGRVLLVCNDSAAIQHLTEGMQQLAIATEVCVHTETALRLLNRKKFEGIIVDFGLDKADQILEQVRLSPSNRTAVTFAIADPGKTAGSEYPTEFPDGKAAFPGFGGADPQSRFRIDRAGAAAFLSLSHRTSGVDPGQWRSSQLPPGEYQRRRNGNHRMRRP